MIQGLTKITTQFGLLSQVDNETAKALQKCGGPYQYWSVAYGKWRDVVGEPPWYADTVYRKKPAPREYVAWMVLKADGTVFGVSFLEDQARSWVVEGRSLIKLTGTHDE